MIYNIGKLLFCGKIWGWSLLDSNLSFFVLFILLVFVLSFCHHHHHHHHHRTQYPAQRRSLGEGRWRTIHTRTSLKGGLEESGLFYLQKERAPHKRKWVTTENVLSLIFTNYGDWLEISGISLIWDMLSSLKYSLSNI